MTTAISSSGITLAEYSQMILEVQEWADKSAGGFIDGLADLSKSMAEKMTMAADRIAEQYRQYSATGSTAWRRRAWRMAA